jgi:peptidoglycan hydrolase-like protein with peptidoglycan-binding domain
MKKGGATAMKGKTAQVVAPPPVVVPKAEARKEKPLTSQHEVENALQNFYAMKWIKTNPGKADAINDNQSKKAIKEYQALFKLDVDGIVGKQTLGSVRKQLPACLQQATSEVLLVELYKAKKIKNDPGSANMTNDAKTQAAVEEFQEANGLLKTGVPDIDTLVKLGEVLSGNAPTSNKPGLAPDVKHLYWVGNSVEPGGTATLRLHAKDLKVDQECPVTLLDAEGKEVASTAKIKVSGKYAEALVAIPKEFAGGSKVFAKVTAALEEDGELEARTSAPLFVRAKGGATTETADWRPYIGKGAVPHEILEIVRRNRAKYPMKSFKAAKGGPKNSPRGYEGPHCWDYSPPKAHNDWAYAYFDQKLQAAPQRQKNMLRAYKLMLRSEGRPASFMTYDNQIVTWGVGLGNKGNGKSTFLNLNKDPEMKKLLDDLGIAYGADRYYHVVDLNHKKVVSSVVSKKLGDDNRHIPPLEAWRQQKDLMSAIIGLSEDPATREKVAEAMYAIYVNETAAFNGQDKIYTLALYFMLTHMRAWLPAIGKKIDVEVEFAAIGGGMPSRETDKKLAHRIAHAFLREAKRFFTVLQSKRGSWIDVRNRTKTRLWKVMKDDGKPEKFDPGELEYAADEAK